MAGVDEVRYTGRCPRFGVCSVNACPLDYRIRPTHPDDPEKTCKAHLRPRMEIAAQAEADGVTLPWAGIRPDEAARLKAGEPIEAILAEWDERELAQRRKGDHIGALHRARMAERKAGANEKKTSYTILAVLLIVKTALFWASVAQGVLA